MSTTNGLLSATGWGQHRVTVTQVAHGVSIITNQDDARSMRSLYLLRRSVAPFTVWVHSASYAESVELAEWLRGYATRAASPGSGVGAMRVQVPSRDFDQLGVPDGEIAYGDRVGAYTYPATLTFQGVADTRERGNPVVATYQAAADKTVSQYFYPAGTQLSGQRVGVDFYDTPTASIGQSQHDIVGALTPGTSTLTDPLDIAAKVLPGLPIRPILPF